MGLFAKLFPGPSDLTKVVDGVASAFNKVRFARENIETERDKHLLEAEQKSMDRIVDWMEATEGQNVARRLIALSTTAIWIFCLLGSGTLSIIAIWSTDPMQWRESSQAITHLADQIDNAMMLILTFYFAGPHVGKVVGPFVERWRHKREQAS